MRSKYYFLLIIVGILLIGFASCTKKLTKVPSEGNLIIFPSPPDTARIQYLTSISNSKDVISKQSKLKKYVFGEEELKSINKPYGVEIENGKIYVCDISIKGLEVIDLKKQTFEYFVPKGKGALMLPVNCFVDKNNTLYIADIQRNEIVIFDRELKFITSFGFSDKLKPSDVFVDNKHIWVSNSNRNKIFAYDKLSYELVDSLPKIEKGKKGYLYSPTNIFVTNDKLYVSDFGDFNIKIYDKNGEFINSVGKYGRNIGQFVRPKGITVDKNSNLFVVDAGFENVQIFNRSGNVLMHFGGSYSGPGYMWLPAKVIIDYENLEFFEQYVDDAYTLNYLIIVTNQYGPDKISIYGAIEPKKPKV